MADFIPRTNTPAGRLRSVPCQSKHFDKTKVGTAVLSHHHPLLSEQLQTRKVLHVEPLAHTHRPQLLRRLLSPLSPRESCELTAQRYAYKMLQTCALRLALLSLLPLATHYATGQNHCGKYNDRADPVKQTAPV